MDYRKDLIMGELSAWYLFVLVIATAVYGASLYICGYYGYLLMAVFLTIFVIMADVLGRILLPWKRYLRK